MIGYKVVTSKGLKGPFKKSSMIKAITSAMVPLQARILELETNRYMYAADLVGESIDPKTHAQDVNPDDLTMAMSPDEILAATEDKLRLEEENETDAPGDEPSQS